ncbi:CPBP family intramembrane glutamic endopeptidase [Allorhodopirellula solitaria]|uniref:CAAX amino terminal protease self-immunity n=1 Tax=Allorhodopirellula solitaria TaxID=2527987 RepID=A0A5C5X1T7_9BACT|nr:type II CAAX endopeptidase family protein [Allorhodopirellula solitaria]TWT56125.1 CAAX amino terminal protease self- immunity [Allorhodopirellula solitaria]
MQAETAVPAPKANVTATTDAAPLSSLELVLSLVSLLILTAFVTSLIKWATLLRHGARLFGERALVPARPRARPYWNPALFLFFFGVLIIASMMLNRWASDAGWIPKPTASAEAEVVAETALPDAITPDEVIPDPVSPVTIDPLTDAENPPATAPTSPPAQEISVPHLFISSAGMLAATIVTLLLAQTFRPSLPTPSSGIDPTVAHERPRIGLVPRRGDLSLGFRAAWLILPPTMLLMGLVSILQKYTHPVLEALKPAGPDSAPDLTVFAALFFTTAIITPLVEEFWFRGLLQGGLQRLADMAVDSQRQWNRLTASRSSSDTEFSPDASNDVVDHPNALATDDPYASPRDLAQNESVAQNHLTARELERDQDTRSDWTPTAVWPILVTSVIFAVMHWGQGLAPIPLFFLSLGLGYLYRQTGSLVPSIVVHFTLNGFTMCVTLLQILR